MNVSLVYIGCSIFGQVLREPISAHTALPRNVGIKCWVVLLHNPSSVTDQTKVTWDSLSPCECESSHCLLGKLLSGVEKLFYA